MKQMTTEGKERVYVSKSGNLCIVQYILKRRKGVYVKLIGPKSNVTIGCNFWSFLCDQGEWSFVGDL